MRNLKVHFYYWIVSGFFILLGFYYINSSDAIIDINVHDTYYIIHNSHVCLLLALVYGLFGFIYWISIIAKIRFNPRLTKLHSILTLGIIPIYFIGYFILSTKKQSQFPLFDDTTTFNLFLFVIASVLVTSQAFLVLNILISLIKLLFKRKA